MLFHECTPLSSGLSWFIHSSLCLGHILYYLSSLELLEPWPCHPWLPPPGSFLGDYHALGDQNPLVGDEAMSVKTHFLLGPLLSLLLCLSI